MSFSLPLQALANFHLVITVPGERTLPPTFELKPLPPHLLLGDGSPTFPTCVQVRARETSSGLTFELTGDNTLVGQTTPFLPTPPESLLGSPQTLMPNVGLEGDYFGTEDFAHHFPAWTQFSDLTDESQTTSLLCSSLSQTESIEITQRTMHSTDFGISNSMFMDSPFAVPSTKPFFSRDASPEDFTSNSTFMLPSYSPQVMTPLESGTPTNELAENPLPSPASNPPSPKLAMSIAPSHSQRSRSRKPSSDTGTPAEKKPEPTQSSRPRPFACRFPGCERVFTSNYTRETHMLTHRPKRKQTYQCTVGCNALFSRKHDRWRHEVSQHGKPSQWTCSRCSQYFSSEKSLSVHNCDRPMRLQWKNQNSSGG
ncbi:hypothetical protein V5O48_005971 [Marasmius crinis-equi]|uniref:C2H2-type domain-containing protein n=1 Tax=Marasmius crinis-equi TaxID=585013 RepID=A0ABR3FL07_9AGAR